MPGHYEGSCPCPTGSVKTNFNILLDVLCLVNKLAMRLQIWCALCRRCVHFVSRRQNPGPQKCTVFAWSVLGSIFRVNQRKESAVCHKADPGGDEDDLGWGQEFCDRRPVRCRLPAVVGAHWKVLSDRQYIGGKFHRNTCFCTSNSLCFISSVAFDFDCTTYNEFRRAFNHPYINKRKNGLSQVLLWFIAPSCNRYPESIRNPPGRK